MADTDPLAAALERIRHRADGDDARVLLAAVEAVLAKHKPLHDAVLAEARHAREWPFAVGDQVHARGDWGSLVCDLRIYTGKRPDAALTVHEVSAEGRWLSLRDEDGRIYAGSCGPAYGPTYFRIAGECGDHFPGYRNPGWPDRQEGAYFCLRCDEPMPDVTRALTGETPGGKEAGDGR